MKLNSTESSVDYLAENRGLLAETLQKVESLTAMVQHLIADQKSRPIIDLKARYTLKEAADYLKVSSSTLSRRSHENRFVIIHDGSRPFVMGAEIMRYAREGGKRRIGIRRNRSTNRRK